MENDSMIKVRRVKTIVRDTEIEFDEKYCCNVVTSEEIYDRDIEIENDINLYDMYKKQNDLLTSIEIKKIRKKYDLIQKEFANSIGVGEITVHRLENGTIQTESIDGIIRLSNEPSNMYDLIMKNSSNISNDCFEKTICIIKRLVELKKHKIAELNYNELNNLEFKQLNVKDVSDNVIYRYNEWCKKVSEQYDIEKDSITQLKLQKLLYYVQGLSLAIFGEKAYDSKILAWSYGPVVEEIYQQYHGQCKNPIDTPKNISVIPDGLNKVIEIVVESYGQIEANKLIAITHEEDPWRETAKDNEILISKIKDYFSAVYEIND